MIEKINQLKADISNLTATDLAQVEALRIKYLSKKGEVSLLFNDFRNVPADQKRAIGQALNELKNLATDKINSLKESLESVDTIDSSLDLTRTGYDAAWKPSPAINCAQRHHINILTPWIYRG